MPPVFGYADIDDRGGAMLAAADAAVAATIGDSIVDIGSLAPRWIGKEQVSLYLSIPACIV